MVRIGPTAATNTIDLLTPLVCCFAGVVHPCAGHSAERQNAGACLHTTPAPGVAFSESVHSTSRRMP